jgi:hypothetical protein
VTQPSFLPFCRLRYLLRMPDLEEKLTPADPEDLAAGLAFALKFEGRKRWHDADAFMADIIAKRLVVPRARRLRRDETPSARRAWGPPRLGPRRLATEQALRRQVETWTGVLSSPLLKALVRPRVWFPLARGSYGAGSAGADVVPATLSGVAEGGGGGCSSELGFRGMSGKSGGRVGGVTGAGAGRGL